MGTGQEGIEAIYDSLHVMYNHCTATFYDDYVSLATTAGRIEADYRLPNDRDETPTASTCFRRVRGDWGGTTPEIR